MADSEERTRREEIVLCARLIRPQLGVLLEVQEASALFGKLEELIPQAGSDIPVAVSTKILQALRTTKATREWARTFLTASKSITRDVGGGATTAYEPLAGHGQPVPASVGYYCPTDGTRWRQQMKGQVPPPCSVCAQPLHLVSN